MKTKETPTEKRCHRVLGFMRDGEDFHLFDVMREYITNHIPFLLRYEPLEPE